MFEDDEDFELNDELLAASDSFIEPHKCSTKICFNCHGSDSGYATFDRNGFVSNHDIGYGFSISPQKSAQETIKLFHINFTDLSSMFRPNIVQVLFNKSRVNIQHLDASSTPNAVLLTNELSFNLRLEVTMFLRYLREMISKGAIKTESVVNGLGSLRVLMGSIETLPIINIVNSVHSTKGNVSTSPAYHLLHGHLEWRWLHLTSLLEIHRSSPDTFETLQETEFELHLRLIITDLITLSICKFNKLKLSDLLYSTPFLCTCTKELWLMIQLLVDKLNEINKLKGFWFYFNGTLNQMRDRINPYNDFAPNTIKRKINDPLIPTDWIRFSIWLLCGIAKVQGYSENGHQMGSNSLRISENYELLDNLTKTLLASQPNEEPLRIMLFLIIPLSSEWWPPNTDYVMLFWEYFHGKLNSTFYIPGSAPSTLAVVNTSVIGQLDQIKSKLNSNQINPNETSFNSFVTLLGKLLQRLRCADGSNQLRKVLGRITSKFSPGKLLALNEIGISNIVSLFTTLALTSELSDMAQRIQNFLFQLPLSRLTMPRQAALMRGHVALLILFFEENLDCSGCITKLLDQLNSIRLDDGYLGCLKILAEGFCEIFTKSKNYNRGQVLLIDSWIITYLSSSSREDEIFLNCLLETLNKMPTVLNSINLNSDDNAQFQKLLESFYKHLLPYVKQSFGNKDTSRFISELAANFCFCSSYYKKEKFEDLFTYFVDVQCKNVQILIEFLVLILSSDKITSITETLIISNWIRCCLCSNTNTENLRNLTNIVVSLSEFQQICDMNLNEITSTDEPLCLFFQGIDNLYKNTTDFNRQSWLIDKVHNYLNPFNKFVSILEADNMKVLSMIGIIILHCSQIVYIRAKSNCFFNIALDQYIMPTDVLMEKEQNSIKVKAIHKIWHLLVTGIEKLDYRNDRHINKVLSNLIVKWMPNFKIFTDKAKLAKPYIYCMNELTDQMASFIFEKIASTFLSLTGRSSHRYSGLALTILNEVYTTICSNEYKLNVFMKCTLSTFIEHAIMVDEKSPNRTLITTLLEKLFTSSTYRLSTNLSAITLTALETITTTKNLSYYSTFYFQFMFKMASFNPLATQDVLSYLLAQITSVETLRGTGRDGRLRSEYAKLNEIVKSKMTN